MTNPYIPVKPLRVHDSPFRRNVSRIEEFCSKKTNVPDCKSEIYIPVPRTTKDADDPAIRILAPGLPQILTKSIAKIDPIDYVTYILSSFSFWFAFSPLVFMTEGFIYNWITSKFNLTNDNKDSIIELRREINEIKRQMVVQLKL